MNHQEELEQIAVDCLRKAAVIEPEKHTALIGRVVEVLKPHIPPPARKVMGDHYTSQTKWGILRDDGTFTFLCDTADETLKEYQSALNGPGVYGVLDNGEHKLVRVLVSYKVIGVFESKSR